MADHYTRVRCGGTPSRSDAPVVGVLYGCYTEEEPTSSREGKRSGESRLEIHHAHECCDWQDLQPPMELHQAVFPSHTLVGWYRVTESGGDSGSLTEDDWNHSLHLHQQYAQARYFALFPVAPPTTTTTRSSSASEELPLVLYQLEQPTPHVKPVMVACESWSLQTAPAEQIAVERVLCQPTTAIATSGANAPESSVYLQQLTTWKHSLQVLQDRVALLQSYVQEQQQQQQAYPSLSESQALHRQLQSLTLALDPLAVASQSLPTTDMPLAESLAVLAQTVNATQQYTEQWRHAQEVGSRGGRERR
jgi:hypothetical protein